MRGHCSARSQVGTGPVRAALAGPAWALHSFVGWDNANFGKKQLGALELLNALAEYRLESIFRIRNLTVSV